MVAWFFALFLEGAAGFGTPVALAAPFLVAAGMPPVPAVAASLMGHAAGVSFGAIGTPVLAQTALVEFSGADLARATAPYHVILGGVLTAAVVLTIGRAVKGDRRLWTWGALAAGSFFVPYALIATFVGPELPTLGGALAGVAVFAVVLVRRRRREAGASGSESAGPGERLALLRAATPYVVLVALVLATRLIPPLRGVLEGVTVEWDTGTGFSGSVRPLFHPALLLTVAFVAGAVGQRASGRDVREAFLTATSYIVAAVATVGLTGQEGKVLRATFPVAALYVALGGLLALAFTR